MDNQDIEISEAFDLMDTNQQMAISPRNFKIAIRALGLELSRDQYIKLISGIEKDQEGFIKKEIFMKEMRKLLSKRDTKNDMIKAFQLIDEDDTGKINFYKLKNVAKMLGEQVSDQEIFNMLDAADEDGDGQVNLTEFMKIMDRARKVL
ncbi:EF-Hand 1, calcium-binding site,EF-hand domain pair,EF-hand domain [Cinara cedri]|uniref:EF-Hand 1, calcium-binding site,EF-hand domain pair,EF-hand domain n=1 Tax=Cinara cedri TaxID=506608 RepID=A0A5E4NQH3_9HEMI|nr:EF-Hand 1, calcium-binding site,EF-hand domain pair,EF-hand domain [Cinara cedri]